MVSVGDGDWRAVRDLDLHKEARPLACRIRRSRQETDSQQRLVATQDKWNFISTSHQRPWVNDGVADIIAEATYW
jgi:hypothetical protein